MSDVRSEGAVPVPTVPTTWLPARKVVAVLAVVTALLTVGAGSAVVGSAWPLYWILAYLAVTVGALVRPALVTAQVVVGQMLCAGLILVGGFDPVLLLGLMAGVVVTAELLGTVARLDMPMARDPRGDLVRAGFAAMLAVGAFGLVTLVGGLPGPSGIVATGLATTGCVLLAVVFVRSG